MFPRTVLEPAQTDSRGDDGRVDTPCQFYIWGESQSVTPCASDGGEYPRRIQESDRRYRSQLWDWHEEARLWVGRPGTDFMVYATACRTAISASARRRVFTITDVRCQKGTWVWPL